MDYTQLKELFSQHESEHPDTHLTAYITFHRPYAADFIRAEYSVGIQKYQAQYGKSYSRRRPPHYEAHRKAVK